MAAILDSPTFPQERCQFFGSQLANTTEFSDQELILEYGRTSNIKIRELKIFVSETHICGIQASYLISDDAANVMGAKHIAPNPTGSVKENFFSVEGDEFITVIAGRHLNSGVTFLEFKTSAGRSFSFGYKKGKAFSKSCVADQQFLILRGGFGEENIHHVGFLAAPLPMFAKINFFQVSSENVIGFEEVEDLQEQKELIPEITTVSNANQRKLLRIIGSQGENCFIDLLRTRCYGLEYKPEEIRVSHNGCNILGIQATYLAIYHGVLVDGDKHYGRLWNEDCTTETIQLNRDEYITTVFGRLKPKEMTQIGFVTNHGREFCFGGHEGHKFTATAPEGCHLASIGGALLSGLGSIILEILPVPKLVETEPKLINQVSLTTSDSGEELSSTAVDCSDAYILLPFNLTHKISQLLVAHDDRRIYGLQASYIIKEGDTVVQGARHFGRNWIAELFEEVVYFEDDEYIEEIFGDRSNESITRFGIKTSFGRTLIFGSQDSSEEGVEFVHIAQPNNHFATLKCSVDGYLQAIDFEEIPKTNTESKQVSQEETNAANKDDKYLSNTTAIHKNLPKFSPTFAGINQGDTVHFSDEDLLNDICPNHKINQIYIKYTTQKILSIQTIYEVFGNKDKEFRVHGTKVESGNNEEDFKEAWIQLDSDELISEVCGKLAGFGLIAFGIKTSKRKSFEFGSAAGEKFQIKAGKGAHCATFKYGLGKNIHYVEINCHPVPKNPASLIHLE